VLRLDEQDHAEQLVLPPDDQVARSVESFAEALRSGLSAGDPREAVACGQTVRMVELIEEIRERAMRVPI
jgi:dTDP-3,4-didehydro-2,6-dideoxy-alpha-D-glucose 3-reductase